MEHIKLRFVCPSCGTKFRSVETMNSATQVVERTCSNQECRDSWRLVVSPLKVEDGRRMDKAEIYFIGRKALTSRQNSEKI